MKKVLMIAPYFPPRRRVGSLRPFKFAIHLQKQGWQPVILTIGQSQNELSEREKKLLEGIRIIRINPPFDKTSTTNTQKKKNKRTSFFNSLGTLASDWIDKHTPVDTWIFLFWIKYLWILHQAQTIKPDLIWSTGDPWSGHWLADKLANDLSKPWVADFRDPWTLTDVNLRQRSAFSSQIDREVERRVAENAVKLVFTSAATEAEYAEHYGTSAKSTTIYNSSDQTLYDDEQEYTWNESLDPHKLHLFFYGSFRRLSPADPVAAGILSLKMKNPEAAGLIQVHSFGKTTEEEKKRLQEFGLNDNFVEHEPVLPEYTNSVLNNADLLLLSTHPDRKHIIPAKLWNYLAAEKPVLSITPNPEIRHILVNRNAGIQIDPEDHDKIADILITFLNAKQENKPLFPASDNSETDRHIFDAEHTAGELASIFDELTTHG